MTKYLKILFIIIITIIVTILIINVFQKENYLPVFYQSFVNQSNSIEVNNLKITLQGFYSNEINNEQISSLSLDEETVNIIQNFSKDKIYNLLIDFSNVAEKGISEPMFDYFIYDNIGNIIFTSMVYKQNANETNSFLKYFMKKEHNSDDITDLNNYIVSSGTTIHIVNGTDNSNLILISSSDNDNFQGNLDLSKIHVLILNPSYKISGNQKRITQENTIYDFVIENYDLNN